MRSLLAAEAYKIKKNPMFWLAIAVTAVCSFFFAQHNYGYYDDVYILPIPFVFAAFISMFCGRLYSDGTIRNLIICGYTKGQIFVAELIVNSVVSMIISAVLILVFGIMNVTAYPIDSILTGKEWMLAAVNVILIYLLYAAIYTLVSMLIANRAWGVLINMALAVAFMVCADLFGSMLEQPKTQTYEICETEALSEEEVAKIKDGTYSGEEYLYVQHFKTETRDNPRYISFKPLRALVYGCDAIFPQAQVTRYMTYLNSSIRYENIEPDISYDLKKQVKTMPFWMMGGIFVASVGGWYLYRRKELQ
ncbi:MAG: hypothetical protein E7282_01145 [Lachnospiraceae bacterium]|nr:hypothetical protein [Lachnospiraceae bacterium]